jgi:hypothetical protein
MGVCIKLNIRKRFLSTSRATAPRRPIETEVTPQRIRATSAGSDSAKALPCAATDGVHRSGSLETRLSSLQLLGTNLIFPRRQRLHDDGPAGKFKSGVVVGSGPILRWPSSLRKFHSPARPRSKTRLHDFRLSIGGTLLQALFFFGFRGSWFFAILIVGAVPQSSGSARAWRPSAVGTRNGQSNGRHVAVADRL